MTNVYKNYKAPSEGGMFLKFEDGEINHLRLGSEPYIFTSSFTDKVTGETTISTKYAWKAWNYGNSLAQVIQLPVSGFRQIQDLAVDPDWGDPTVYDIKITRTGKGLTTKYSVVPNPNKSALGKEEKEALDAIRVGEAVKGVPLSQVADGADLPLPPKNKIKDVIIEDMDENEKVNLDEIPF